MNRFVTRLIVVGGLLVSAPAFARSSHTMGAPSDPHAVHETHELQEKVQRLDRDIKQDDRKLAVDQQKLDLLKIQAAEAKVGKAPPLSPNEQREVVELQRRIGGLDRDIGHDTQRLAQDETKLKAWQPPPAP